ncbi:CoA ester lyase [Luteimonas fraxinea]|uniref:CoA ester lyase n=1 Tax=Luteimonas fraxinea TaxID=2901869 RepID=A0ABS8UE31_9GAMM|nr:CoA ester lyase [Luteimonas fraxinea]MCD9097319.1 CoA ester lyase [Luteimonas fraxinea]MCD9125117.1 CoA ester lyase [Luteimonas fraxinea]UHH11580.1 CoA ester lyase [Luteimonas fraxinea]
MRSKLFVPGVRPDLFGKAWKGQADAVSFDLEDAVADARKAEARANVAAFLQAQTRGAGAPLAIVRTNAPDSPEYDADLAAVLPAAPDLINLPKTDSADDVRAAVARIEAQEAALGIAPSVGLLLNIETPRALRNAAAIATAHPRVAGLQLGLGDLFEPGGIHRVPAHVQAVMLQVALAAAEAGVFACDGAWADLADDAGFEREAQLARQLGFVGKSCIHPRQVPLAHAVFAVDADELARAHRIVNGAADARREGRAVCVVDGRMIDAPYLRRAERVLAHASRDARARDASPT